MRVTRRGQKGGGTALIPSDNRPTTRLHATPAVYFTLYSLRQFRVAYTGY